MVGPDDFKRRKEQMTPEKSLETRSMEEIDILLTLSASAGA